MFIYFFAGNFMFGSMAYIPLGMFIDRPIYALLNLKKDVRDARHSQYYKLSEYLENFRPQIEDEVADPLVTLRLAEGDADSSQATEV